MPQLDRATIKERARLLRDRGTEALRRHLHREVGTTRRILAESASAGRTEHFTAVRFAAPVEPGSIVERTIAGHDGRQLLAA
jgi:threonylcarbamoyladenosine tRNA methylthiotransferase MtaB